MLNNFLLAGASTTNIVWLVVLVVLIVVMLVLPTITQNKKIKAYQEMQSRLKVGTKVQTIGGVVGKIVKIKEANGAKTVFIETGDKNNKMVIEFDINAIAGVVEGVVTTSTEAETAKTEETTEDAEMVNVDAEEKTAEQPEEAKPEKKSKKK